MGIKRTELRVKIKSLAAEARIIRNEEGRFPRGQRHHTTFQSLHSHRTGIVRREARHALLAYAFMRGRQYRQLEAKTHAEPDAGLICGIIKRFAGDAMTRDQLQKLPLWVKEWLEIDIKPASLEPETENKLAA